VIQLLTKAFAMVLLPLFVMYFIIEELFFSLRYRLTGLRPPERKVLP
jgi:hypothetical protein